MTLTTNIIVLTPEQYPHRWAGAGRRDVWVHEGVVTAGGDAFLTHLSTEDASPADRVDQGTLDQWHRRHGGAPGQEVIGRNRAVTDLRYNEVQGGGRRVSEVLEGPVLRGRAVTHTGEFFGDLVPDGPLRFFVTEHDGGFYLCSVDAFPGGVDLVLPVGEHEWSGFGARLTDEAQARRMTRPREADAARVEVADLVREIAEARTDGTQFVRDVQSKAREAKARGWCGEVEKMLAEAGVSSQWQSTGVVTVEISFADLPIDLAHSTNPRTVATRVVSMVKEALPEGMTVRRTGTATVDGAAVSD